MHGPTQLFTVIALVSLPTVMYGGYALMGVMRDRKLTEHQRAMFRAGHAHAGVLLILALVALQILSRTTLSDTTLWIGCFLLLFGILAQSGGFFFHLIPGRGKLGGRVTSAGALLLAAATLLTAYGVAFA
ncbi:hypothetical protein AMES_0897 [Amycolatopsis mediterranei S699]|uniref:Integral membrane protein n=2 Tax=Amycolatopsis mediterranei TaxID=33910 RepID=A0A0H3CXQ6_AMYMU|nr:hypothetical protein [Amycolatopsis mediterranei]ADJ42719.1 conserved hypothetical protein [Amycolatopsis mediterranei U32]AEK39410.1 hypothetical protein RAM_04590 [Amycolatopsis mediterranei S699]AFO74433.1 hypothetical protein AMES_0897 [Amycolatopsis mediterranei S699]AGT81562.1 hypothetical protein B737_0898 [Amycolatopsis mediterranei RB]KDO09981.1 hypothetical protein DV26_14980 [Amycolatopsis mediterranei]